MALLTLSVLENVEMLLVYNHALQTPAEKKEEKWEKRDFLPIYRFTSLLWWWTAQTQSGWFRCSRMWWQCDRNPVFLDGVVHLSLWFDKLEENNPDLCIDACQGYVEWGSVHQVMPSPLPGTSKDLDEFSWFGNFLDALFQEGKPPPADSDDFSFTFRNKIYQKYTAKICLILFWIEDSPR